MNRKLIPTYKLINIGCTNVGKSSILLKYTKDEFKESISNTVGIDNVNKEVYINGNPIILQIWDTAGQERFNSIVKSYYRGADGFIFVFDLSDQRSFEYIKERIQTIRQENKNVKFGILVGNKSDLIDNEKLNYFKNELNELSKLYNYDNFITSAKTGQNISNLFEELADKIHSQKKIENEQYEILKKIEFTKKTRRFCC